MYLLSAFRFSTYLTLLLASLALGYAEFGLLPEIPLIMVFAAVLLVLGYSLEGHWAMSLNSANIMGAVLIALLGLWGAYQFVRPPIGLAEQIPFPVRLLPYFGPVLLVLIPAKLFRPKLHADYWAMQGIGLLAVALGCAMAHDGLFGFLMILYLFSFVWSMTLFYLGRCAGVIETEVGKPSLDFGKKLRWLMIGTTVKWSVLIVGVSVPLFLVTPRPGNNRWELPYVSRGRMETGVSNSDIDLNRTGSVETNEEVAFEVYAEDRLGRAKTDLNSNQLWHVTSLTQYEKGRWLREKNNGLSLQNLSSVGSISIPEPLPTIRQRFPQLPDYGTLQYYLVFSPHRPSTDVKALAYPVYWQVNQSSPVEVLDSGRAIPVSQLRDGSFEWQMNRKNSEGEIGYVQTTVEMYDFNLSPPLILSSASNIDALTRIPDRTGIPRFTEELLDRLIREAQLPPATRKELDRISGKPLPQYRAVIAKALERHLALSEEYRYSLQLRREDRTLDPIEDFLVNTKSGHCQRYATALTLMLRSQGIPARFVLGFKGSEVRSPGNYVVRQNQAHAWVEALIPDPWGAKALFNAHSAVLGGPGAIVSVEFQRDHTEPTYRWLTLDPTPAGDELGDTVKADAWFDDSFMRWSNWFRQFILGYNESLRGETIEAIIDRLTDGMVLVIEGEIVWPWYGGALLVALFAIRKFRMRRRTSQARTGFSTPFQTRLWALLARSGLNPKIGQTPREFAARAADVLAQHAETLPSAAIPPQVTELYYRVNYGGRPLDAVEQKEVEARLDQLQIALLALVQPLASTP